MNRTTLNGIVLAAALCMGAPAAWAANTETVRTSTAIELPAGPQEAAIRPAEPEPVAADLPEAEQPFAPQLSAQADAEPARLANWIVYLALGIAVFASLIGIGLSVFAYVAYRSLADYTYRNDESTEAHAARLNALDANVREVKAGLTTLLSQVRDQRVASRSQPAPVSDWDNASALSRAPVAPPEPLQASAREVADLLDAYRLVLSAKGPEQLASFKAEYQPATLSVTVDQISEAHDGDDNVWLITKPHWGDEGIVLPGSHAIRAWGTTFQPSGGRAAQNQFGPIYTVLLGNVLEVEQPARVQKRSNGDFRLTEKGVLRGA